VRRFQRNDESDKHKLQSGPWTAVLSITGQSRVAAILGPLVTQSFQLKELEALAATAKADTCLAAAKENHYSKVLALHKLNPSKYDVGRVTALYKKDRQQNSCSRCKCCSHCKCCSTIYMFFNSLCWFGNMEIILIG
jgi:hypothetical protein